MILRLWRGWTTPENADRYEELIAITIFPGILARTIAGLEGLELFRRPIGTEVEFMTLMRFASWDAVKAFAGPDCEVSVVPTAARALLARYDKRAAHYEQRVPHEPARDRLRQGIHPAPSAAPVIGKRHSETSRKRRFRQRSAGVEKKRSVLLVGEYHGKLLTEIVHQGRATIEKDRGGSRTETNPALWCFRCRSLP
jgi:hypothetical protein